MSQIFTQNLTSPTNGVPIFNAQIDPDERYLVRVYHSADAVETSLDQGFGTIVRDVGGTWFELTLEPGDSLYSRGVGAAKYVISRHPSIVVKKAVDEGFKRLLAAMGVQAPRPQGDPEQDGFHDSEPDMLDQLACGNDLLDQLR